MKDQIKGHIHIRCELFSDERSFDVVIVAYVNFSFSDNIKTISASFVKDLGNQLYENVFG